MLEPPHGTPGIKTSHPSSGIATKHGWGIARAEASLVGQLQEGVFLSPPLFFPPSKSVDVIAGSLS